MKKALLLLGLLALSCIGFAQVSQPISNFEVQVLDNDTVLLTWDLPEDYNASPMELSWVRSDTINDMVQYGYDSYMGALYDESDLCQFIGWNIESISFYKISNWTHFISVFEQKQGEEMHELYWQEIPEEAPFGLNTIMLEEDLQIERSTKYWFAIRIKNEGQYGYIYPIGTWDGQANEGKSDLFLNYGASTWFCYPWINGWIKTTIVNTEGKENKSVQTNDKDNQPLTGYRIYREGEHIKDIPYCFVTYFTDTEFTRARDVEYCVTAIYGDEESEPVCATASITGVVDYLGNDGISVSPNPSNGLIRIEGATVSEVQVYNAFGQLVKRVQNSNEIDLSHLTPGVYSLRIKDIQCIKTNIKVVVKQH